jgi:hypothetical protein
MSRIHLTIGIICIFIIAVAGMITELVSIGEGIIIILITSLAAPFLFDLLKKTTKHDKGH